MLAFLDQFIPQKAKQTPTEHMRSYVLTGVILGNISGLVLFFVIFLLFVEIPDVARGVAFGLCGYYLVSLIGILFVFKRSGSVRLGANLDMLIQTSVIFAAIHATGGFQESPIVQVLFLCPLVALLMLGLKDGIIWLSIVLGFSILSYVSYLMGVGYINLVNEDIYGFMSVGLYFLIFFMVGAGIITYEMINRVLKAQLKQDGEKFKSMAMVAIQSGTVNERADSLAEAGEALLSSAVQQRVAIQELSSVTEELAATAEQNSHLAASAHTSVKQTGEHLQISNKDILKLISSMNDVKQSSEEIQSINNVINDIAYQTNVLSLNALIEASRAAGGGGGFQVVAQEVQNLAEKSAEAADNINKLLANNFESVQNGFLLSEKMQERFNEITEMIGPLAINIQNITDASHEQNEAIRQITRGLLDIDKAISKNEERAKVSADTANELRSNAAKLNTIVHALENKSKKF